MSIYPTAWSEEVNWLSEVQSPPEVASAFNVGHLAPLLTREDGQIGSATEVWKTRREELCAKWNAFLGPNPLVASNNDVTILKSESVGDVNRLLIRYECEPNLFVNAYLLRPSTENTIRRPGIVALHQTTTDTIDQIAGVSGPESQQLGLKMAKRGFVVICPRCFLWQDSTSLNEAVDSFKKRHPQSLGMRKMLFDAQRAVDILVAQPDVDPTRLGALGHSLGAKEVLYLAAFDERVKVSVASEGGIALGSTNWDAPWYLGPTIRESSFARNHHELLALVAPRALLVIGGESGSGAADGDRSWPLIAAAFPVHKLYRENPRLGLLNHRQGHTIPEDTMRRIVNWLETYLK